MRHSGGFVPHVLLQTLLPRVTACYWSRFPKQAIAGTGDTPAGFTGKDSRMKNWPGSHVFSHPTFRGREFPSHNFTCGLTCETKKQHLPSVFACTRTFLQFIDRFELTDGTSSKRQAEETRNFASPASSFGALLSSRRMWGKQPCPSCTENESHSSPKPVHRDHWWWRSPLRNTFLWNPEFAVIFTSEFWSIHFAYHWKGSFDYILKPTLFERLYSLEHVR